MTTSSLSLIPRIHTELSINICECAENRSSKLVWETRERVSSEVFERKSRLFYTHNIFRIKSYSFIASRIRKKYMKYCENHVFLWKLSHFYVLFLAHLSRGRRTTFADQGPPKTVAFFRIPTKLFMPGTWNFRIIKRNIKAIFREYFSSLCFDSGKIYLVKSS